MTCSLFSAMFVCMLTLFSFDVAESIACIKEPGVVCGLYRLGADDCVSASLPGLAR